MVGLILRYGSKVVAVTAKDLETAEHIALELLEAVGIYAEGEEVTMVVFDPTEPGGVIVDTANSDMQGWTQDGFSPPAPPE